MEHGDSNSDALICFDTKFKSIVYLKLIESDIDFTKLSRNQHNKRLVECSEAHCFDAQFVCRLRVRIQLSMFLIPFFFLQFSQNKAGEYEFIVHSNEF